MCSILELQLRLVNWPLEKVTSLKVNALKEKTKSTLSQDSKDKLAKWLDADMKLYEFFKGRLEREISQFGERQMDERVRALKLENEKKMRLCNFTLKSHGELSPVFKPYHRNSMGFSVNENSPESCTWMVMPEIPMVEIARIKQVERTVKKLEKIGKRRDVERFESVYAKKREELKDFL